MQMIFRPSNFFSGTCRSNTLVDTPYAMIVLSKQIGFCQIYPKDKET